MVIAAALLAANMAIMPMDCAQVQSLVAQYGRTRAVAWALEQMALGTYSWKEFRMAKQCLAVQKSKS